MASPRAEAALRSVQNTRKITKTMELVPKSKLKRAQDRVVGARPYAQALAEVIQRSLLATLASGSRCAPAGTGGMRRVAVLAHYFQSGLCRRVQPPPDS